MPQLPLIEMTTERLPGKLPPQTDVYLVAAVNLHGPWWKIHRDSGMQEYGSIEEATIAAQKLGIGWGHLTILHVRLGEKGEGDVNG